ncbi:MAG TPA: response regulator [Flavobacterium sp.]|jgi:CheY-like chemotaxis protein
MDKNGPIIIIEDDKDDREILGEIFRKLEYKNEVCFFSDGQEALNFLLDQKGSPFLILSDINMPKLNGLELREIILRNEDLRMKSIPFLFFTTATTKKSVLDAYALAVQGFFIKPTSFRELEQTIRKIIEYWSNCQSPGDFL